MDSHLFADFMGGSPVAQVSSSDKSLWDRLVRETRKDSGDDTGTVLMLLPESPAAQLVEFRDKHQRSVTHLAILAEYLELLEFVLESGAPLDTQDECGASPLTTALIGRHYQAAAMLATYGCDVDHVNTALQTAMHVLATYGALDAVQWLLDRGADMEARDADGNSPLHLAAAYCSLPVVEFLLATGADVNARNTSEATPLHFAAPNGNRAVVEALIKYGGDLDARDERGNTPLIDAAFTSQSAAPHFASGDENTQHAVVELLLQHGAEVNAANNDGDSALFGAVRNEYDSVVKLLLAHGADARVRNNQQETLLHVLARGYVSNVAIWRQLLQHQADISAQDQRNFTCAMVWASRRRAFPVSDAILNGDGTQQHDVAWVEHIFAKEFAAT